MKQLIELTIKIPIHFEIEKGQPETKDNPEYPNKIIDHYFDEDEMVAALDDAMLADLDRIDTEIFEETKKGNGN